MIYDLQQIEPLLGYEDDLPVYRLHLLFKNGNELVLPCTRYQFENVEEVDEHGHIIPKLYLRWDDLPGWHVTLMQLDMSEVCATFVERNAAAKQLDIERALADQRGNAELLLQDAGELKYL